MNIHIICNRLISYHRCNNIRNGD